MTHAKTLAALLVAGALVPAVALADLSLTKPVGLTDEEITTTLTEAGYTVGPIERETDEIEVEVTKDGIVFEVELDPATGTIMELERDDD